MAGSKSQHELTVEIAGKIASSFGSAMGTVNKQMATLGKFASGTAKITAKGMKWSGAAIVGVATASAMVGKEFEAQMSTVAAISGATGEEFAALEAKAKEMGATTQFSASEAGQAMEYMAMAGWKSADMVDGISGIMNLAAASGEDLASTSDIVTDALTAFGLTSSESGRFADVLAAASSNANTNVAMLGESFKYVAPLAGTLGYTAEDTSIALGLMANAGIKGSQAGTSLKTAIANMSAPTAKQAAAMEKLGISLTDNEGNMKSMREVMVNMRSSFANLSEAEQTAAASTIFGKEAMSGMLAIINAGESDFNSLTAAIDESTGAAKRMAAVRLDNLEGDITLLKSGLEGLGIEIYQGMNAPMREAAQAASGYVEQMNAAFQEGGFSGMAAVIGDVSADALTRLADNAPEFIDMAATLIDGFISGIDKNSDKIGASMGRLITVLASAIVRLSPRLVVTGGNLLMSIAQGIIQNLPELGAGAREAVAYLMNAAKDALAEYAGFLGDDSVAPFEKFIALIPAVAVGFAAFGGISKITGKISGFIKSIKSAGKAAPGFTQASNEMSAAAKNIAAVGAGLALAAAGVWLLADAAVRIADAGLAAKAGFVALAAGVGTLMLIASKLGPELAAAKNGLISFGTAVLMISAGMSLMAYTATQLGAAGPAAIAGLAIMEGGMIAMMVIAESFGKKLAGAAPGLLAFGAAIFMAAAGMSLMAMAATQVAAAGLPAIITLTIMTAGIIAFMEIAATMGAKLTAASVGFIALGGGIALAAAGMYILAQAAIQLGTAGTSAQVTMVLLAAGIFAFGAAAAAFAPLLLAGAAALAAFGAALVVVSTAATLGSAALLIISAALPALSEYGASGALAILELGAAMTVFAGPAALAGAGAAAAGLGFGTLALAAAAADLAFAPLALEMPAVAAAIAGIAAGAGTGAVGINSLQKSSSGMIAAMGKLAVAFVPVAAAITPFAVSAGAGAAAGTALAAALMAAVLAITAFKVAVSMMAVATVTQFIGQWKIGSQSVIAIWNSFRNSFASAWTGVHFYAVNAAQNTAQQIKAAFENMTITVPCPRLPHVSVSYSTQGGAGDASVRVPEFSVSYYANGGIMTAPTVFGMVGGEKGPEGIVPLDPFWNRLDGTLAAAQQPDTSGQFAQAVQDAAGLANMQSAAGGADSRAKDLYNDITNNSTTNQTNNNSEVSNRPIFTFSPQVVIQGNATEEDVHKGTTMSQEDFNRYVDEYIWQKGRTGMA